MSSGVEVRGNESSPTGAYRPCHGLARAPHDVRGCAQLRVGDGQGDVGRTSRRVRGVAGSVAPVCSPGFASDVSVRVGRRPGPRRWINDGPGGAYFAMVVNAAV